MEQAHIAQSLALVAFAFAGAACGEPDVHMRPELPSDVTTTTAAPAAPSPATESSVRSTSVQISQPSPSSPDGDVATGARSIDKTSAPPAGAQPMPSSAWDSSRKIRRSQATFTDAEIAAVVDAAGRAERQLARDAAKRAQSPRVRQIAQRVLSDHGEAKLERVERTASLSLVDSATSTELKSNAASAAQSLRLARSEDFDQLYVDALASEERRLVDLLDRELIPQAQSEELRSLLQDLRTSASSRLGMAEAAGAR